MSIAIKVENLGKRYFLNHQQQSHYQYSSLSENLNKSFSNIKNRIFDSKRIQAETQDQEEFWALKDINFEIQHGDRVGIIGRNGAGKSTLLKILSRITHPTTGKVTLNGRVSSLLEVGTGFHPELTGRENIFLNGAILGMRKHEIQRKFDEIVDFAEVEKFLDTPVKHYSSGMYVRLAFAVAAHLEPEILIVDEVLSVGDVQFQRKCLGKMESISQGQGRTILFVSHSMQAVKQLCDNILCIEKGSIEFAGLPYDGINFYYRKNRPSSIDFSNSNAEAFITNLNFLDKDNLHKHRFNQEEKLTISTIIQLNKPYKRLNISMAISHGETGPIFSESMEDYLDIPELDAGTYTAVFKVDLKYLKPEHYFLTIHLVDLYTGEVASHVDNIPLPEIYASEYDQVIESRRWGVIRIPVEFTQYNTCSPEKHNNLITK